MALDQTFFLEMPPIQAALLIELSRHFKSEGDAMIFLILRDEDGHPSRLIVRSTPVSTRTTVDIATFATERAIAHTGLLTDGSGDAARRHLEDALRSLQAASTAADQPTVGRA